MIGRPAIVFKHHRPVVSFWHAIDVRLFSSGSDYMENQNGEFNYVTGESNSDVAHQNSGPFSLYDKDIMFAFRRRIPSRMK
jgi:hypothetical protein